MPSPANEHVLPFVESTYQVVTVVLPTGNGKILKIRKATTPEPVHKQIYTTLQMPMEGMKPVRTWHDEVPEIVTE
jgi:hypothetical protein